MKNRVKPDTFAALRTGPLHIATLFSESVVKKAEEEIALYDKKSHPTPCIKNRYHPYERTDKKQEGRSEGKQDWKNRSQASHPDLLGVSSNTIDSYCFSRGSSQLLTWNVPTEETMNNLLFSNVKPHVIKFVPSSPGLPQRKGISPGVPECQSKKSQLKSVKSASCVTQLSCVNPVSNVTNVAPKVLANLVESGCPSESS